LRGGVSVVYRAERTGDYEQTVAVNLLRRRVHSCEVARRLRAERQVLASSDPLDIASPCDGGVTNEQAGGRLYLVVEYGKKR
jgi:hypothetical protein